jgi:hypothetical protein
MTLISISSPPTRMGALADRPEDVIAAAHRHGIEF